jgi:hypothetical protein
MPRKWSANWKGGVGFRGDADRDQLIHTLGNLTLLTSRLNTKVSNARWPGRSGKREALKKFETLLINRDLLERAGEAWSDDAIRARTDAMAPMILEIWPAPPGHRSGFGGSKKRAQRKIDLADLINAGLLQPGATLYPRLKAFSGKVATLLPDGQIDVEGVTYPRPRNAAGAILGKPRNGWWLFLVTREPKRSLSAVRREYIERLSLDADEVGDDDGDDDDDEG